MDRMERMDQQREGGVCLRSARRPLSPWVVTGLYSLASVVLGLALLEVTPRPEAVFAGYLFCGVAAWWLEERRLGDEARTWLRAERLAISLSLPLTVALLLALIALGRWVTFGTDWEVFDLLATLAVIFALPVQLAFSCGRLAALGRRGVAVWPELVVYAALVVGALLRYG
ncbi:MAG: hypothetical protein IJF59_03580 [Clostridia bacterium]|nr:hypothetical protein [Clostridia bacterium]